MGKKKRGHFCKVCGRIRANEKFSGKGHRQHICKDCKRKGKKLKQPSTSAYDREFHYLNKAIKNCLLFYTRHSDFFLFEFREERFVTRGDFESEIFVYQPNGNQKFLVEESLHSYDALMEVLFKKYYETIGSENVLDYEIFIEDSSLDISKKRRQHLEVIDSMNHLV
ncbi:hypothetical protein [Aquibacillus sediminis]|uniref:hypothetical protein n=1 Tax=Aquibacillus sediminis TaxID=2574734 RepID=UPI001108C230|nr:hypothetical protein [Aquibacillus sediminis]